MTKAPNLPSIDDFVSEGDDISDNVDRLNETIAQLIDSTTEYDKKTNDFINVKLPPIWKNILTSFHSLRVKPKEITQFFKRYCQLCYHTDLIPSLVLTIPTAFDSSFSQGNFYKIESLPTEEEVDNILNSTYDENSNSTNNILLPQLEKSNSVFHSLIVQIIQSHLFAKTRELYQNEKLTIEQISAIDQVFICIESSITEELVSAILPMLIDISIKLICTDYLDSNNKTSSVLPQICKFLSTFARMISQLEKIDEIFNVLCRLSSEDCPVKTRHIAISEMIHIIDTVGFGNSAEMVKKAMIKALETSSQQSMLNSICNFLPKLAESTQFDDEDLHILLLKARNGDDQIVSAFIKAIDSVDRSIDECAKELTNYDILSPSLYCSVIGKTNDEEITRTLFQQLLSKTDRLMAKKGSIAHVVLNDRIKQHMNEEGVDLIKLLTFLFLCAPNVDTICNFIIRVFNLPELPDDLIPMLNNFTRKINDFDSTPSILALFNVLIERLKKKEDFDKNGQSQENEEEDNQQFTNSLTQVVTQWIKASNMINPESPKILKQLSELDFSLINEYVKWLTDELILKCDRNTNVEFLFKVLNDTVPENHAQWLIYRLFDLVHDDERHINKCFDIIIDHIQSIQNTEIDQKSRFMNGVFLLFNAVAYEADFYELGEQNYGFLQNIHIQDDNDTRLVISLHPFHSTRRIFEEVGNALNYKSDQFQLIFNDGEQDKELKYKVPLETVSAIGLHKTKKYIDSNIQSNISSLEISIEPKVQLYDDYQATPTPFLNLLSKKVSLLFDLLEYVVDQHEDESGSTVEYSLESEYIFQIIKLFPPLNVEPKNAIQEVIVEKISLQKAIMFKDSPRIFPYAVACSTNNFVKEIDNESDIESEKELIKMLIIELASHYYDIVSLSIACRALSNVKIHIRFDQQNLKKCLIECTSTQIRIITSKIVSHEAEDRDLFMSLMDYTLLKKNRVKTQQFFECILQMNFEKEIFIPFYQKLEQFEFSYYLDSDQTFIALLKLIPQTPEMVELTINRLFSPPTCRHETVPFVHTVDSWNEALRFIETSLSIPRLHPLLSTLPFPQDINQIKLSADFTFKGRIGIINMGSTCYMNSLLQSLNSFQGVAHNITSKDKKISKHMTPFILEFRNCMAKLRYLRGTTLSLSQLSTTIEPEKTFDPKLQQDIGEFFDQIVSKINEELKEEDDVTDQMKINFSNIVSDDDHIYSTKEDSTFNISLQIENISNLSDAFDAYFEDEKIEYQVGEKKVPAKLWKSIKKWPDYLVIQLQRWSYNLETMERCKLVHAFDFPVILKGDDIKIHHEEQRCDSDYALSAVVIHQGTPDQGHYFAIVQGDDNEWYHCNDKLIEYFDINELATWSFGQQNSTDDSQSIEDVFTGYLLFYKKIGLVQNNEQNSCFITHELEEEIDKENANNWGSTIFYSEDFVDYIKRMTFLNYKNNQMLDIAFTVLFKIAVCDEKILHEWTEFIINLNDEKDNLYFVYERMFDYIETEIGTSLVHLFAITENRTNYLSTMINSSLSKLTNSTKPIRSILKCVPDGQFLKRMFCLFIFDSITNAYQTLRNNINWSEEEETLKMMLNILSIQLSKEVQRQISKQHILSMNNVLSLFIEVVKVKGCDETVLSVFDISRMNKINYIYKKCDNFNKLMLTVNSMHSDIFYDTADATPGTLELLSPILQQQNLNENETTEQISLDLNFLFSSIENLIFCEDSKIRKDANDILIEMCGKKDEELVNYFKEALIKDQYNITLKEENTVALFVIGQFDRMNEIINQSEDDKTNDNYFNGNFEDVDKEEYNDLERKFYDEHYPNETICIEFSEVIIRITCITPNVLTKEFPTIVNMYINSKHMILKRKLLKIIHHILCYDKTIINEENYHELFKEILNSNVTSSYATQIIWVFQDQANQTVLSGACVDYYLRSSYDENADILIKMLENGLNPAEVDIPNKVNDFHVHRLKIVNELWKVWPDKHRELSNFMLSTFDHAKPYPLYQNSITLSKSMELLNEFCPDELNNKIKEINENQNN